MQCGIRIDSMPSNFIRNASSVAVESMLISCGLNSSAGASATCNVVTGSVIPAVEVAAADVVILLEESTAPPPPPGAPAAAVGEDSSGGVSITYTRQGDMLSGVWCVSFLFAQSSAVSCTTSVHFCTRQRLSARSRRDKETGPPTLNIPRVGTTSTSASITPSPAVPHLEVFASTATPAPGTPAEFARIITRRRRSMSFNMISTTFCTYTKDRNSNFFKPTVCRCDQAVYNHSKNFPPPAL
mmetsp:Transcript_23949/g.39993  ORF Transcript_23949/g.39993 Transcript_23949/m.39993 type:complete len:241 (+) Transcript_23949:296-1018(+)